MDLEKLNSIDTTKPDQVKELQQFLKTRGYYNGPKTDIDGKWGGLTTEGAAKLRADLQAENDRALKLEETRTAGKVAEAQGKQAENDPTARLTKMGTEIAPYVAGAGVGTVLGHKFGTAYAAQDKKSAEGVGRLAKALDVNPTVKEAQLDQGNAARGRRNAFQFAAPALLGGAGYVTREYLAPAFSDPQTQDIIRGVGTGENAAAMATGLHQLISTLGRGNPNDPLDEARIRSGAQGGQLAKALAGSRPPAPPPRPAAPSIAEPPAALPPPEGAPPSETPPSKIPHRDRLISAAREAGAAGDLTKASAAEHLASNITDANRGAVAKALGVNNGPNLASRLTSAIERMASKPGASSIMLPLAAGALAYDATNKQANAADGGPGSFVAPTTAAATTAGSTYGGMKLSDAIAKAIPMAGKAIGSGFSMMNPMMLSDMMDSEHQFGPEENARAQAAQDRTVGALRSMVTPGNATPQETQGSVYPEAVPSAPPGPPQAAPQPMMRAAALQMPENVPPDAALQAEQEAQFHPAVQGRLQRMIALGAPPEAIAQFLNAAVAR